MACGGHVSYIVVLLYDLHRCDLFCPSVSNEADEALHASVPREYASATRYICGIKVDDPYPEGDQSQRAWATRAET